MTIVWRLAEVMTERRIKGVVLAKVLGLHPSAVSRLRVRQTMPRLTGDFLDALCAALDCEPGDLIKRVRE